MKPLFNGAVVASLLFLLFPVTALLLYGTKKDGAILLLLLGLSMMFAAYKNTPDKLPTPARTWFRILPWILLTASLGCGLLWGGQMVWPSLFLAFLACISYFSNQLIFLKLLIPAAILYLLVPNADQMQIFLGAPMGQLSAILASKMLTVLGVEHTLSLNLFTIDQRQIAITTACSGVELLEVMLLLGWFTIYFRVHSLRLQILNYAAMLPIILFANTLRISAVILLSIGIGDRAFQEPYHSLFGYLVIILTMSAVFYLGELLRRMES